MAQGRPAPTPPPPSRGEEGGVDVPAKKAFDQGRTLGPERLHQAIQLLAEADLDLKGASGLDDDIVLDVLVARLCRLAPRSRR
jgi:DNA polymerase III delta subunit